MRIVFAGTPAVAARTLAVLLPRHEVLAAVTRPDAPKGRSGRPTPSPVAELAEAAGIEVLKPSRPAAPELLSRMRELRPELGIAVAYGGLIPDDLLAVPTHGWWNAHFSLLPRWRGAAPVQRAILAGDELTGVTLFQLVTELDAGPVLAQVQTPIGAKTAGELLDELQGLGGELILDNIGKLAAGGLRRHSQPAEGVTYAAKLHPQDAELDWSEDAETLEREIRAFNPAPLAWTGFAGKRLQIRTAEITREVLPPGSLQPRKRELLAGTGSTALRLLQVVPEGKQAMDGAAWGRGLRGEGLRLG
ncbi:MAG: methionyl-tRNA formyltransferase [Propionibacteriaceae bacterium]|jgi:methionyl-tRNA formyltransferase|nr:methionyl-tRNA formyltransferase [Propionibacteriaceae bacterium]